MEPAAIAKSFLDYTQESEKGRFILFSTFWVQVEKYTRISCSG
jgi:hypothetical protein